MILHAKPAPMPVNRPDDARFSSGPCKKRPNWSLANLQNAPLGRSHRHKIGKQRLQQAIDLSRQLLQIPDDYRIGIAPASDTGAMEMALWSLLGSKPVDVLVWESFGKGWETDICQQLKLSDVRVLDAPYGSLPDLDGVREDADVIFTWNGTTSGVRVPNADWIGDERSGLTICDATSAAFAQKLDWGKLDVVTWSWQKVMGGEAAHGMIVLSPRAVQRLESYAPTWPVPKIFRLTKNGKINESFFTGSTINTPSMLCVEDYIDTLNWGLGLGGLEALHQRCDDNLAVMESWVSKTPWVGFLAADPKTRSNTGVCLQFADPKIRSLPVVEQSALVKRMTALLEQEAAAFDIGGYRDAPPGLRIWCGATIEKSDLQLLTTWLDWAYDKALGAYSPSIQKVGTGFG
ncbi:MAG: phosphoserine transaminase [Robiginitomaculum sp.]|nr:phosphoserine transaminase [Robiginitomaculum sp.]